VQVNSKRRVNEPLEIAIPLGVALGIAFGVIVGDEKEPTLILWPSCPEVAGSNPVIHPN
jgi:hypothetical protein